MCMYKCLLYQQLPPNILTMNLSRADCMKRLKHIHEIYNKYTVGITYVDDDEPFNPTAKGRKVRNLPLEAVFFSDYLYNSVVQQTTADARSIRPNSRNILLFEPQENKTKFDKFCELCTAFTNTYAMDFYYDATNVNDVPVQVVNDVVGDVHNLHENQQFMDSVNMFGTRLALYFGARHAAMRTHTDPSYFG